ncbi:diacylglycerol/lipid kinase family protein [Alkalibacterium pelagium]|uniref:Lipid kinase, YegS/Rv2252/BmrU family n=1 Tax=Alkalibacterium pelagium TaxID=426702 RepID=A0A1H7NJZ0_9LACT|nr:diacylglycerol kinase family protein [Alkalibacterium pelagium]GEN51454.1 diacylglycerol kinase [Alkalibacterium pelagium]SEL23870.1 lipid kinase, YegS/Rv2252/BmrU family [Alkalibacterium pelagium]
MTKAVVIVNPTSGKEEGEEYGPEVKRELEKMYSEVELRWTEGEGDATRFAREACREEVDAIYALGGDGTVNECVNGIAPEDYRPPFGFIPLGTVNDLGRVLDIPMNPKKAVEKLTERTKRVIDVGKINDQYFVDIVAIGSIPDAVHEVPIEKKTKLGPLAYVIEGVKAINEKEVYPFQFEVDGEQLEEESFLVLVAVTNSVAGITTMIPEADVDDGYLHLAVVKGDTIAEKVNLVPKIFAGKVTDDENVLYRKFTKGSIRLKEGFEKEIVTNVDGDEGDSLPIDLEVKKHHMTVFVPDTDNNQ